MRWKIEKTGKTVATLTIQAERNRAWEQRILLTADRHFDNVLSNRSLQEKHLREARDLYGAPVVDLGDCFCAMQGRNDKRSDKSHVRPENMTADYFGSLVRSGAEFFKPYASSLALLGQGNHESSILKHNEIDLTSCLVDSLQANGSPVVAGGYRGWLRIKLEASTQRQSFDLYYTHGTGGSSPVTKGTIRTNRRASYIDADIICAGHIHEAWTVELCRVGLTHHGKEMVKDQLHICIPTYKEEFTDEPGGFHHEKEGPPKPLGAWWLVFFFDQDEERFKVTCQRAK